MKKHNLVLDVENIERRIAENFPNSRWIVKAIRRHARMQTGIALAMTLTSRCLPAICFMARWLEYAHSAEPKS